MSEKVVLPKDVADAVRRIRSVTGTAEAYDLGLLRADAEKGNDLTRVILDYVEVNGPQKYFAALVNGYTIEQTPEDRVREVYEESKRSQPMSYLDGKAAGIEITLAILGLEIDGINVEEGGR